MAWFVYGYFVRLPDRSIVPAGYDFGPTADSYAVGDSLGVKGDSEAFVIGILKGKAAKMSGGYDVFVLLEQRRVREKGSSPPPPWDFFQREEGLRYIETLMRGPARLVSRPQIQAVVGDRKFRAVGKNLYQRPLNESFYDFQLKHLLWLLGGEWYNAEMAKPIEDRHIILKWRAERNEQLRKYQDPKDPGALVRAPITGGMRALQVLADDLYQLAHALEPPQAILSRLRDVRQFQGARYEILTASLFARCGFEVEFIDDASRRNPEFIAQKESERIAVEAKSRHRAGVLNERGAFREDAAAEIRRLYDDAAGQNPGDCPFLIFIDVNLPLTPDVPPLEKPWIVEAMRVFDHREQESLQNRDTALILTNFGWHFSREESAPAGENFWARVEHPRYPLRPATLELLGRAISEYGKVVDEEERDDRA
jgi:hypothetical protein